MFLPNSLKKSVVFCVGLGCLLLQTSCSLFTPTQHFSPEQQKDFAALEQGLNNPGTIKYAFRQYGSFGEGSGTLYYHPGAIKLEYDDPKGNWSLGKDEKLVFYDVTTGALSKWSLKKSPLKALLTLPVKIHASGVKVADVTENDEGVHLVLESRKLLGSMAVSVDYKIQPENIDLQGLTISMMSKKLILVLSNPQEVEGVDFSEPAKSN